MCAQQGPSGNPSANSSKTCQIRLMTNNTAVLETQNHQQHHHHHQPHPRSAPNRPSPHSVLSTKTQRNITKMLLLISTTFLVLNMPSYAIRLYIFLFYSLWEVTAPSNLWCIQQFCMLLFYTNFSINFLLYAMYGVTFRRCLLQLVRRKLRSLVRLRGKQLGHGCRLNNRFQTVTLTEEQKTFWMGASNLSKLARTSRFRCVGEDGFCYFCTPEQQPADEE